MSATKLKRKKIQTPEKEVENSVPPPPTEAQLMAPPSTTVTTKSGSFDLEREEMVQDERGDYYLRKTPRGMFEDAEAEVNQLELEDYSDTIALLRTKGFSFREIGQFLTKRGVYADHNAVYRVYTKNLTEDEIRAEAELDDKISQRPS